MDIVNPPNPPEDQSTFNPALTQHETHFHAETVKSAGFIRRAIAYLIDCVMIVVLLQFFLMAGKMGTLLSSGEKGLFDISGWGSTIFNGLLFIYIGYFTFFHTNCGQTPAKMIMRIKVITSNLETPSPLKAFIRTLSYFVSFLFFGLGFFIIIFERKKRALHDLLTGTQVILSP